MAKDWIIEVLGDLHGFAAANDLPTLADQLEEAIVIASAELGQVGPVPTGVGHHGSQIGRSAGTVG